MLHSKEFESLKTICYNTPAHENVIKQKAKNKLCICDNISFGTELAVRQKRTDYRRLVQ